MAKQDSQARCWTFTVNNYTDEEFKNIKKIDCQYMVVGKEVGEKGTPHLQGYIQLEKKKRFKQVKRLLGRGHIEKARGNAQENKTYCSKGGDVFEKGDMKVEGKKYLLDIVHDIVKGETGLEEKYGDMYIRNKRKVIEVANDVLQRKEKESAEKLYKDVELREWQKDALERLNSQSRRQILFVVDEKGNSGKSWLAEYLVVVKKKCIVFQNGKSTDIAHAYNGQHYIVFDFERENLDIINYGIIERLKNGLVFSAKYDSGMKFFNIKPKIVVFMNQEPKMTAFSEDRYDLLIINKVH